MSFLENALSAVIVANPKTIINKFKCPKSIQSYIYKYDQLTNLLNREMSYKKNDPEIPEKQMYEIANYLVKSNKPIKFNYNAKYSLTDEDFEMSKKVVVNDVVVSQKPDGIKAVDSTKAPVKETPFRAFDYRYFRD